MRAAHLVERRRPHWARGRDGVKETRAVLSCRPVPGAPRMAAKACPRKLVSWEENTVHPDQQGSDGTGTEVADRYVSAPVNALCPPQGDVYRNEPPNPKEPRMKKRTAILSGVGGLVAAGLLVAMIVLATGGGDPSVTAVAAGHALHNSGQATTANGETMNTDGQRMMTDGQMMQAGGQKMIDAAAAMAKGQTGQDQP